MRERSKTKILSDKMYVDNSIGLLLSETWLNDTIVDAEVFIEVSPSTVVIDPVEVEAEVQFT